MPSQPRLTPRPAGVKDVARRAGVSLGTVSNVLNRPERVGATTRQRVEQAIQELGFVRDETARRLRSGRSSTVAYVMLDVTNPFFTDVARGLEDALEEAGDGLSLFLCNSDQRPERELAHLTGLQQQRVLGVLVTPIDPDASSLDDLAAAGVPVVVVDRVRSVESHCSVAVDSVFGGRLAVEHLVDIGHEHLAFVGGPDRIGQVRDRLRGAREALAAADLDADRLLTLPTTTLTVAAGREAGSRIAGLPRRSRPTAAFCANDLLALGLLQQCVTLGIEVPGDLAIVGYDDIEFADAAAVPLTSVRQPRHELGRRAAELLLSEVTDGDHHHEQVLLSPELVARRSTLG